PGVEAPAGPALDFSSSQFGTSGDLAASISYDPAVNGLRIAIERMDGQPQAATGQIFTGSFLLPAGSPANPLRTQAGGWTVMIDNVDLKRAPDAAPQPHATLSLPPNPCHNATTLNWAGQDAATLHIIAADGRALLQTEVALPYRLDAANLPAGRYLARLQNADGTSAHKWIVVQH
ncbi:MAG: T9SS type A sorting domain-containing protein, partial [Bacteroidota bacterium]